jgi:hypothetical protein
MEKLNQRKLALATGTTSIVIYLGCFGIMALFGKDSLVKLSNLLFHGMDFSNIIRMDIPISETIIGVFVSFLFWAIVGYVLAIIYNTISNTNKV